MRHPFFNVIEETDAWGCRRPKHGSGYQGTRMAIVAYYSLAYRLFTHFAKRLFI